MENSWSGCIKCISLGADVLTGVLSFCLGYSITLLGCHVGLCISGRSVYDGLWHSSGMACRQLQHHIWGRLGHPL